MSLVVDNQLTVLIERRNWLTERVKAKQIVGWDVVWDIRERDALTWAINILEKNLNTQTIINDLHERNVWPYNT